METPVSVFNRDNTFFKLGIALMVSCQAIHLVIMVASTIKLAKQVCSMVELLVYARHTMWHCFIQRISYCGAFVFDKIENRDSHDVNCFSQ
eukprot:m.131387 g.131387  ORF g.131387 m.131387 type:complete len:91 (-) comp17476_c0_seq1:1591-1863(-)